LETCIPVLRPQVPVLAAGCKVEVAGIVVGIGCLSAVEDVEVLEVRDPWAISGRRRKIFAQLSRSNRNGNGPRGSARESRAYGALAAGYGEPNLGAVYCCGRRRRRVAVRMEMAANIKRFYMGCIC
jgi:hypothetical protein